MTAYLPSHVRKCYNNVIKGCHWSFTQMRNIPFAQLFYRYVDFKNMAQLGILSCQPLKNGSPSGGNPITLLKESSVNLNSNSQFEHVPRQNFGRMIEQVYHCNLEIFAESLTDLAPPPYLCSSDIQGCTRIGRM